MTSDIIESNSHLALFEGWRFMDNAPEDFPSGYYTLEKDDVKHFAETVKQMNYHDSWDWLIPVYNQCLELYTDKKGFPDFKNDGAFQLAEFSLKTALSTSGVNNQLNISSAYLKISDFIKWYHSKVFKK